MIDDPTIAVALGAGLVTLRVNSTFNRQTTGGEDGQHREEGVETHVDRKVGSMEQELCKKVFGVD